MTINTRLYLSSEGVGYHADRMLDMFSEGGRIGIIANAVDYKEQNARDRFVGSQYAMLEELGLTPEEIDLTDYFNRPDDAIDKRIAQNYDGVWVTGGNVFMLRGSMERSGLNGHIGRLVMESGLVYAGYSAGSCQTARHLYGLELVDPLHQVPDRYCVADMFKGLGFMDKLIVPHFDSPDNPCTGDIDVVVARLEELRSPHIKLRDGDAVVVHGGVQEVLRSPSSN